MKKRIIAVLTAALMLLVLSPQAFAEEVPEEPAAEAVEEATEAAPENVEVVTEELAPETSADEEPANELNESISEPEEIMPAEIIPEETAEGSETIQAEEPANNDIVPAIDTQSDEIAIQQEIPAEIPAGAPFESQSDIGEPPEYQSNGISLQAEKNTDYTILGVDAHTQDEIRAYITANGVLSAADAPVIYDVNPVVSPNSYEPGVLNEQTKKSALAMLNNIRYIAGLDAVSLDESLAAQEQAAALVNSANDVLDHFPYQPAGMDDDLYELGYAGCSSSNLACFLSTGYRVITPYECMIGWMEDSDQYNIDRLGHRRWCIDPAMGKFAYGIVENYNPDLFFSYTTYSAMSVFDDSNSDAYQYNVSWPAQQMPLEYFPDMSAWSLSVGEGIDINSVNVTLTRLNDGRVWNFSVGNSDGYFNVDNAGYGQSGCIIFRPDSMSYSNGDKFSVKITGLPNSSTLNYNVEFFSLLQNEPEPEQPIDPDPTQPDPDIPTDPTSPNPDKPKDPTITNPDKPTDPVIHDPDIPTDPTDPATPDDPADADPGTPAKPEVIKGDLLNKGKPSLGSFSLLGQYLLKMRDLSEEQKQAADMNGDGNVSMADFALLGRLLLNRD